MSQTLRVFKTLRVSLLNRPPPVSLNHCVNLFHQADGLLERDDETLVWAMSSAVRVRPG